ncbi:helix-turn-helix transcriptional regulator [Streptosporangiaceae bacterium NEAU-GS5]|nr:helix-turn-helix transcriptional regulator [Streptosporangiaceae bacterium NEAU-GS5]
MIRTRRLALGLTQDEEAQRAQISWLALSRIEGGGGVPTLAMLERVARAMGTTLTITVGQDAAA